MAVGLIIHILITLIVHLGVIVGVFFLFHLLYFFTIGEEG